MIDGFISFNLIWLFFSRAVFILFRLRNCQLWLPHTIKSNFVEEKYTNNDEKSRGGDEREERKRTMLKIAFDDN